MVEKNIYEALQKVKDRIYDINKKIYENPIPTSDIIYKKILYDIVSSEDTCFYYLRLLKESNHIFVIHIVEPDEVLKIPGLYGYVVTDKPLIESLFIEYKKKLEQIYELEKRKKAGADTIIRELFPHIKSYNNTSIGRFLNITIMLDQFIRIIIEKPYEFTEEYKANQLKKILQVSESSHIESFYVEETTFEENKNSVESKVKRRAVDTEEYQELSRMNLSGNWGQAVKKYGAQFLIKVHLRKLELDVVKKLLLNKHIAREEDLYFLRDSLRKMEERSIYDKQLAERLNEIKELQRITQLKINQFFLIRKKYGEV